MLELPPLYVITSPNSASGLALHEQIRRLARAGFPLIQFRAKSMSLNEQWAELRLALEESHSNGGWPMICINDRVDLALLAAQAGFQPWGLHLGQQDVPPSEVAKLQELKSLHLGTSTHNVREWQELDPACDHAGLGPFRATLTKGDHETPIGLEGVRQGCQILKDKGIATVAIGGIGLADMPLLFEAGAHSLAMIGEVERNQDPSELLWIAQLERWKHQPLRVKGQGVALCGCSGAGKTELAKRISQKDGLPYVDLDAAIAAHAGMSILEIFENKGESAFRALEVLVLEQSLASPCVLALGAGALESVLSRQLLLKAEFRVLWLAEQPQQAWERVAGDPGRPLAQDRDLFMGRCRERLAHWSLYPMILPLGRQAEQLAQAICSA